MKKYIIFLCKDTRQNPAVSLLQVAKVVKRLKPYQAGDFLSIDIEEHYETKKGKVLSLVKESVLCQVFKVWKNVIYVNIVGE